MVFVVNSPDGRAIAFKTEEERDAFIKEENSNVELKTPTDKTLDAWAEKAQKMFLEGKFQDVETLQNALAELDRIRFPKETQSQTIWDPDSRFNRVLRYLYRDVERRRMETKYDPKVGTKYNDDFDYYWSHGKKQSLEEGFFTGENIDGRSVTEIMSVSLCDKFPVANIETMYTWGTVKTNLYDQFTGNPLADLSKFPKMQEYADQRFKSSLIAAEDVGSKDVHRCWTLMSDRRKKLCAEAFIEKFENGRSGSGFLDRIVDYDAEKESESDMLCRAEFALLVADNLPNLDRLL